MRAFATVVLFVSSVFTSPVLGQIKEFPYAAKVIADESYARSGAGDGYYPTQKLTRDTVVTVHRHDPGGWYMIDPPEGSFSWIPERFVKRLSDTEGEVRDENVIAFVGSDFGDEASVFHRRLKTGEKVTILGERKIDTTSGPQLMLQIKPPVRERRWIPGSAVVPVDPQKRQEMNSDPYAVPGNAKRPEGAIVTPAQILESKTTIASGVMDVPPIQPSPQLSHLQQIRAEQQQLSEIDRRFREMILRDTSAWDLNSIESEYRSLQQSASHQPISGQIDMRYPAIERYRRRLSQLKDLKEVTSQTEMRDSQLIARHQTHGGLQPPALASAGPESIVIAGEAPRVSEAFEMFLHRDVSNIASSESSTTIPTTTASASSSDSGTQEVITPSSPQNRFIGAGIIQRSADSGQGSGFVLMAPSGRVLADLKPTGNVRLDEFVGQQVGVQGSRWSEKEKRDVIEVSALEVVRIRQ
jgi:hypothetical protein